MTNADPHDSSSTPLLRREKKVLLGLAITLLFACLLAFVLYDLVPPGPKPLGKASYPRTAYDIRNAIPLLEQALDGANRVVVVPRKGLLFDRMWRTKPHGPNEVRSLRPCGIHYCAGAETVQDFLSYFTYCTDAEALDEKMIVFADTKDETYDLIFHFYRDDTLLVVLGYLGFHRTPAFTDHQEEHSKCYLRWIDGGWEHELVPCRSWCNGLLQYWLEENGMSTHSNDGGIQRR